MEGHKNNVLEGVGPSEKSLPPPVNPDYGNNFEHSSNIYPMTNKDGYTH